MRKIKDFFYDKNDIIIVLIIVAVAAFIIYSRIGDIMNYPEVLAKQAAATQTSESAKEKTQSTSSTSATTTTASTAAQVVTITITDSDTSMSVATKLQQAGLVSSDTEFQSYISNKNKEGSIKSGTFQITKGSSNEEILNIIAN